MDFETAAKKIKELKYRPDDDTLLKLYGLYKQATLGDCNLPQPWFYEVKQLAKWNAWTSQKGKLKKVASNEYIKLVTKLIEKI